MKTCLNCGREFPEKRSTARYCSATCRVAYNRHKIDIEQEMTIALRIVDKLGTALLEDKELSHDAAIALETIKTLMFAYFPRGFSWWHCDNCHINWNGFLPDEKNARCQCESGKSKWYKLNTMI